MRLFLISLSSINVKSPLINGLWNKYQISSLLDQILVKVSLSMVKNLSVSEISIFYRSFKNISKKGNFFIDFIFYKKLLSCSTTYNCFLFNCKIYNTIYTFIFVSKQHGHFCPHILMINTFCHGQKYTIVVMQLNQISVLFLWDFYSIFTSFFCHMESKNVTYFLKNRNFFPVIISYI